MATVDRLVANVLNGTHSASIIEHDLPAPLPEFGGTEISILPGEDLLQYCCTYCRVSIGRKWLDVFGIKRQHVGVVRLIQEADYARAAGNRLCLLAAEQTH